MADEADIADSVQQCKLDATIKTSENLSRNYYKSIEGDGFCIDCGRIVEKVRCRIKNERGEWIFKMIFPRFCCNECRDVWEYEH